MDDRACFRTPSIRARDRPRPSTTLRWRALRDRRRLRSSQSGRRNNMGGDHWTLARQPRGRTCGRGRSRGSPSGYPTRLRGCGVARARPRCPGHRAAPGAPTRRSGHPVGAPVRPRRPRRSDHRSSAPLSRHPSASRARVGARIVTAGNPDWRPALDRDGLCFHPHHRCTRGQLAVRVRAVCLAPTKALWNPNHHPLSAWYGSSPR